MAERRDVPRETKLDAIDLALLAALREIASRKAEEQLERRAKMTVVEGRRAGGRAA